MTGSDRMPRPIEHVVTPSWVPESERARCRTRPSAVPAALSPSPAARSSLDRSEATSASSAATKTPVAAINRQTASRPSAEAIGSVFQVVGLVGVEVDGGRGPRPAA